MEVEVEMWKKVFKCNKTFCVLFGFVFVITASCARSDKYITHPVVTESYLLLDQSNYDKSIYMLEDYVDSYPDDKEAIIILGSAYVGKSGINIYKLYDSYNDVFFKTSIIDQINKTEQVISETEKNQAESQNQKNKVRKFLKELDGFLVKLKDYLDFMHLLPDVEEKNWILMDRGLELLSLIDNRKDINLYRAYARASYLKSFLFNKFIDDPSLGSYFWICQLDLEVMYKDLKWSINTAEIILEDLHLSYPEKVTNFRNIEVSLRKFLAYLDLLQEETPVGGSTGLFVLQEKIKGNLNCDEITN